MTLTATFSTGFTDTYKGKRDVKAAWAIINRETGAVINSGHSLDAAKAAKTAETAEGNLQSVWFERDFCISEHPLRYVKGTGAYLTRKQNAEAKAHNAARLDFIRSKVRIEIVAL